MNKDKYDEIDLLQAYQKMCNIHGICPIPESLVAFLPSYGPSNKKWSSEKSVLYSLLSYYFSEQQIKLGTGGL